MCVYSTQKLFILSQKLIKIILYKTIYMENVKQYRFGKFTYNFID